MNFVKNLQRRRELRKMYQLVKDHPTPSNHAALCERLLTVEGAGAVLPRVEDALREFPWSEKLQVLALRVRRAASRAECDALHAAIRKSPSPDTYGRLADLLRAIGDEDEAIRVCHDCSSRFPQNENAFLVEGQIRAERFLRTGSARDGALAVERLERAVVLNAENLKARRLLGQVYSELGAPEHAYLHLRFIQSRSDIDLELERLLSEVSRSRSEGGTTDSEDIPSLLRARSSGDAADGKRDGGNPAGARLEQMAERLRVHEDIDDVALLSSDGHPVDLSSDRPFAPLARHLAEAARTSLLEMDMGNLRHAQVSGPWGHLLLFRFGKALLAARSNGLVQPADVREAVLSIPADERPVA